MFSKICLLVLSLSWLASPLSIYPSANPETYYYGGTILTMAQEKNPQYVEALAAVNSKITWTGTLAEAQARAKPEARWINLNGKTLLPGFIDSHSHLSSVGFTSVIARLYPHPDGQVDSIGSLQDAMRTWMRMNDDFVRRSGWVMGFGYDDSNLEELRHPQKQDLDEVSKDVPIVVIHQSLHIGVFNSKGLEYFNITKSTEDPVGGRYRRKPNSTQPTGVVEQNAFFQLLKEITKLLPSSSRKSLVLEAQRLYASQGYTTVQDGRTQPLVVDYFIELAQKRLLFLDVCAYADYFDTKIWREHKKAQKIIETVADDGQDASPDYEAEDQWSAFQGKRYRHHFRVAGVKIALDGSIQGKTGWLEQPYVKPPQNMPDNYVGYPIVDQLTLNQAVSDILSKNTQLTIHVNGDAALNQFLTAIEAANSSSNCSNLFTNLDDRRIVSIHSQLARAQHLDQMIEYKIIPSFFGEHAFYWGDWHSSETLGKERASGISPAKSALDKGMLFTEHTDAPVVLPNALMMIWAIVNRVTRSGVTLGQEQKIDTFTALKTVTKWAAYQLFEQDTKGTLEAGKIADFVILSHNPLEVDPMSLRDIEVVTTIKGGKVVYTGDSDWAGTDAEY